MRSKLTVPHALAPVAPLTAEDVLKPEPWAGKYRVTHPMTVNNTQQVLQGVIDGPEHVLWNDKATGAKQLWTSSKNGTLYSVRFHDGVPDASTLTEQVYAGPGRVLGFAWDTADGVYICNALQERPPSPGMLQVPLRVQPNDCLKDTWTVHPV
jgi:hypothetical protein